MTCIVGLEADGCVFIGADSSYTDGNTQGLVAPDTPKLWRLGDYMIGIAGSARVNDVLRCHAELPPAPSRGLFRHMVSKVVPAIRKALKKTGRMLKEQNMDRSGYGHEGGDVSDGALLVGVRGKLYAIHSDFQVCHSRSGYDSIGSGSGVALGAFHASRGKLPAERIRLALEAAEAHACGVRRPWRFLRE